MQTVTVRMYETYDLATTQGKMGLIAIRTPSMPYIEKRYPGLVRQFKFVSLNSCNVNLSCASSLPVDPLGIGTTAGKIAPQDMFNPLLYTAVSNDSWNGIIDRIYSGSNYMASMSGSVKQLEHPFPSATDNAASNRDPYYALLAENKFKKAFVQAGLSMSGLVPIVYPVLTPNGQNASLTGTDIPNLSNFNDQYGLDGSGLPVKVGMNAQAGNALIKGHPQKLPRLQTKVYAYNQGDETVVSTTPSIMIGGIPSCYVACIITPPAVLQRTYFRMTVCWTATFSVLESDILLGPVLSDKDLSRYVYYNGIGNSIAAKGLEEVSDTSVNADDGDVHRSVVADGLDMNLVLEK